MREVDLLVFLVPFVEREVDDPRERELIFLDELQLVADAVARDAGELIKVCRIARDEEDGIASLQAVLSTIEVAALAISIALGSPRFLATGPWA